MQVTECNDYQLSCTVQPLLSSHYCDPQDFEKWPHNRGWPLKIEVQHKLDRKGSKHEFIASI